MPLQLSLPFEIDHDRALRLWILATADAQIPMLRQALSDNQPEFLFESATGACPVGPDDAVLLRLASGRYEGFGATAALVADAAEKDRSLMATISASAQTDPRRGSELLAAWPGLPPHQHRLDIRTTLDSLFEQLGGVARRSAHDRLEICDRLIDVLGDGQADLKRLLTNHAAVLRLRLGDASATLTDPTPAWIRPPRWSRVIRPSSPPLRTTAIQPDLFSVGVGGHREPAMPGLGAFRVWGVSLPLTIPGSRFGRPRFFGPPPIFSLDDAALSTLLGPIGASAVVAVVKLACCGNDRSLRLSLEWEVQQRLGEVFASAPAASKLQVWVEDRHGSAVTVAKRIDVGQDFETPADPLMTDGRIVGAVAFRTPSGFESRQPFTLAA